MTPAEDIALLEKIRDRASVVAPDLATSMGETHKDHLTRITLTRSGAHAPVTQTPAPPGAPPATITGRLRGSIRCTRGAGGGTYASSVVSANTIYAATQEFGGIHHGDMFLWVRYIGREEVIRRGWRKRAVNIPARPYMRPSADAVIADGSVTRNANAIFMARVLGGVI